MKRKLVSGVIITLICSLTVLTLFYGNLFNKLNQVSFASGGDGLQSFINMDYHIRYDTTYLRCNSMNYPYGEHVFFTNNQPFFSNTVKFISENIIDISDYTLGMLNFLMLFFLVITPVILFLIFDHFGVGTVVSLIASLAITYMSPQLDRFGGHFNLSYVAAIPLMILLLLKFFKKPGILLSLIIFLTVLVGSVTHFYHYGFFAVLILFFYGAELLRKKTFKNNWQLLFHLFIQLILPFLVLQLFYISDHVTDRPSYPWGFLYYRAYPHSVLLPISRPYGSFVHKILNTRYIDWEGYAFIGIVASAATFYFLFRFVKNMFQKKYNLAFDVTGNRSLNILFWASFAALLYSFGLPFILGLEWLVDLIGPVRQMRGIARFAWVFFYIMNIVTVYWLWQWIKNDKTIVAKVIIVAALTIMCIDAYYVVRNRGKLLENHIPELVDNGFSTPENRWLKHIDPAKYQAFIPIPYFHIGSENIWRDGGWEIISKSLLTIKNSGLPCTGTLLSRTSLSQTIASMSLMLGPACDQLNEERFPSRKPFLILTKPSALINDFEQQLINHSSLIDSTGGFYIYEMPFENLRIITDTMANQVTRESENATSPGNNMYVSGYYSGKAKNKNIIFDGNFPETDTSLNYIISFRFHHISDDLYPRTSLRINEYDTAGTLVNSFSNPVSLLIKAIDKDKALIELDYKLQSKSNRISIILNNKTLRNKKLEIDNLLIRNAGMDLYEQIPGGIIKNNRRYVKCDEPTTNAIPSS